MLMTDVISLDSLDDLLEKCIGGSTDWSQMVFVSTCAAKTNILLSGSKPNSLNDFGKNP